MECSARNMLPERLRSDADGHIPGEAAEPAGYGHQLALALRVALLFCSLRYPGGKLLDKALGRRPLPDCPPRVRGDPGNAPPAEVTRLCISRNSPSRAFSAAPTDWTSSPARAAMSLPSG